MAGLARPQSQDRPLKAGAHLCPQRKPKVLLMVEVLPKCVCDFLWARRTSRVFMGHVRQAGELGVGVGWGWGLGGKRGGRIVSLGA